MLRLFKYLLFLYAKLGGARKCWGGCGWGLDVGKVLNWFEIASYIYSETPLYFFLNRIFPWKKNAAWLKLMVFFSARPRARLVQLSYFFFSPPFFFDLPANFDLFSPLFYSWYNGMWVSLSLNQYSSPNMLKRRRRIYVSRLFKWLENSFFYRLNLIGLLARKIVYIIFYTKKYILLSVLTV